MRSAPPSFAAMALAACLAAATTTMPIGAIDGQAAQVPATIYACPMHPDATASAPGTCPRCGMTLVLMDPFDVAVGRGLRRLGHGRRLLSWPNRHAAGPVAEKLPAAKIFWDPVEPTRGFVVMKFG